MHICTHIYIYIYIHEGRAHAGLDHKNPARAFLQVDDLAHPCAPPPARPPLFSFSNPVMYIYIYMYTCPTLGKQ